MTILIPFILWRSHTDIICSLEVPLLYSCTTSFLVKIADACFGVNVKVEIGYIEKYE
jgi:hypothetical protein